MLVSGVNNDSPNFGVISKYKVKGKNLRRSPLTQDLMDAIQKSDTFLYPGKRTVAVLRSRDYASFGDQFATGVTLNDKVPRYVVEIAIYDKTNDSTPKGFFDKLKYIYDKYMNEKETIETAPELMLSRGNDFNDVMSKLITAISKGERPSKYMFPTF
jgi:hypothetical protein